MTLKRLFIMLTEEANYKNNISNMIFSARKPIIEHLMKLYFYGDKSEQDREHWKDEITSFLFYTPKLKGSNKFPSYELIKETPWDDSQDVFKKDYEHYIKSFNNKYSKRFGYIKPTQQDYNNISNLCEGYFTWLAKELSQKGEVADEDIFNELEKLLTKN